MMRVTGFLLVFAIFTPFYVQAASVVGEAESVVGAVFLNPDAADGRNLQERDSLETSDTVVTGDDGNAGIRLIDGSQLLVDTNSRVVLAEYDLTAEPNSVLDLVRGRMRSVVTETFSRRKNSFRVRTNTAIMGVQGTDFVAYSDVELTLVYVFKGWVEVRNIDPAVKGTVLLGPGQSTEVRRGKPPAELPDPVGEVDKDDPKIGSGGVIDRRSGGSQVGDPHGLFPPTDLGRTNSVPPPPNLPRP